MTPAAPRGNSPGAVSSSLRWALPIFGVAIVVVMWLGVWALLDADRQRTEQEAYARAAASTQAYEAQLQRLLEQVEQLTAFVALQAETRGARLDLSQLVHQTLANQPALRGLFVTNEHGDIIAAGLEEAPPSAYGSVADREYFLVHKTGYDKALYVGEPILGRVVNRWVVHLSRARHDSDGSFAGVVVATVDPDHLVHFYNEAQFGRQGLVSLVGTDWILRARRSGDRVWFGDRAGQHFLARQFAKAPAGTYLADSQLDGIQRFMAYRSLPSYDLIAYTGLSRQEVMAAYEARRNTLLTFFLAATLAVVGAFVMFSRLLRRLYASRQAADESARRFMAASDAQLDAFFILSAKRGKDGQLEDFICRHANRRAIQWLDMPRERIEDQSATMHIPPELRPRLFGAYCTVVETREPITEEFVVQREGRSPLSVVQQVVPAGDGVAITMRDVTDLRRKERELRNSQTALAASEQRLRAITDNLPVLISYIDQALHVHFINATYDRWFGPPEAASENPRLSDYWTPALYEQRIPYVMRALAGETVEYLTERDTLAGRRFLQNIYIPDRGEDGEVRGIYMLSTDVTDLKRAEQELVELLHTDTLTGLANRRSFNEKLPQAMSRARRNGTGLAVLYVDVDRFKGINDTHGHPAGDAVLIEVAHRLRRTVRVSDFVARISGDEFVIVLEDLNAPMETAFVARKLIRQFETPVSTGAAEVPVTISVGVAFENEQLDDDTRLLHKADEALYRAKAQGRNAYVMAA